jgi:hypothetical protein
MRRMEKRIDHLRQNGVENHTRVSSQVVPKGHEGVTMVCHTIRSNHSPETCFDLLRVMSAFVFLASASTYHCFEIVAAHGVALALCFGTQRGQRAVA